MIESTEERARLSPLSHSVDAEGRYWDHGAPPSEGGHRGRSPVHAMPHPPAEGSLHELSSSLGVPVLYQWADGLWHATCSGALRLAFTPEWIASRGGSYVRPIEPQVEIDEERKPRSRKDT